MKRVRRVREPETLRGRELGQLAAGSNSYRFSDQPGGSATYLYRLKMVEAATAKWLPST